MMKKLFLMMICVLPFWQIRPIDESLKSSIAYASLIAGGACLFTAADLTFNQFWLRKQRANYLKTETLSGLRQARARHFSSICSSPYPNQCNSGLVRGLCPNHPDRPPESIKRSDERTKQNLAYGKFGQQINNKHFMYAGIFAGIGIGCFFFGKKVLES
jgi:hypothetical protein